MPGTNDLGPFGPGVNETYTEPESLGDSGGGAYSWFKDCTAPGSTDGTKFMAQWANRMMKQVRRATDGMGISRNETDGDRLLKAIQKADRPIDSVGDGEDIYDGTTEAGHHRVRTLDAAGGIVINVVDGDKLVVDGSGITLASEGDRPAYTFEGNKTASAAPRAPMTAAEATALLVPFVASGASHKKGLVPDPGVTAGSSRFLNEDGTWKSVLPVDDGIGTVVMVRSEAEFTVLANVATTAITDGGLPATVTLPSAYATTTNGWPSDASGTWTRRGIVSVGSFRLVPDGDSATLIYFKGAAVYQRTA